MSALTGCRVLVTGAGGFIGSALCERLLLEGAVVRAFVRYTSRGECGWLDEVAAAGDLEVVAGDLKDAEAVRRAVRGTEIVFHLGALVAIPYSYVHPFDFVQANVLGTVHVLDACREAGVGRLIHTSTSEAYGTARYVPIDEGHPLVGQSPYAASKIAAEQLATSYQRSFGLPVVVVRPFNTYGPRQSARAVVPSIVSQCLSRAEVRVGSTHPTRDLTYVDDTVEGFVRVATAEGVIGEAVNLGSGREVSVGDLAGRILRLASSRARLVRDELRVRPTASEVERLCADNGKARRLLGWEPRIGLDEGLSRTIAWVAEHPGRFRPDGYAV